MSNTESLKNRKGEIRKEINRHLRDQDPSLRAERSAKIQEKLLVSEEYKASRVVMMYVSMPTEVSTEHLIKESLKQGKRVAVPYIGTNDLEITASEIKTIEDLEEGPYGIYQPKEGLKSVIALKDIDLIVVPAIAYDRDNRRLGRGKGYYDRFLSQPDLESAVTIGLAFNFQILDSLPTDPHDIPVARVITDQ